MISFFEGTYRLGDLEGGGKASDLLVIPGWSGWRGDERLLLLG